MIEHLHAYALWLGPAGLAALWVSKAGLGYVAYRYVRRRRPGGER